MRRLRFRSLQGRLTAVAVLFAALGIAILTIAFNLVLSATAHRDVDHQLRTQAAAASTTVVIDHGRLRVRESPGDRALDRQVWIYQGTRALERPPDGRDVQRAADALAGRAGVFADLPERELRMYAQPIIDGGRQVGTVVAAQSLRGYDRTTDLALAGSIALAALLLATVLVLTYLVVGRALGPVRAMTRSAAEWSAHDPERRFGAQARPGELGELAHTFDDLLDRVSASMRHERRLSSELSHELRTPLSRIVAATELLQRRERSAEDRSEAYDAIARAATRMSTILETLMAAARADAGLDRGRSDLRSSLERLAQNWRPVLDERGVALDVADVAPSLVVGVDGDVVERIVAPIIDNAGHFARSRVRIAARAVNGGAELTVSDDGPGVPDEERERIFEPGTRLAEPGGHPGAGLGLSLARRLARAAQGDVVALPAADGDGARFRVRLPG